MEGRIVAVVALALVAGVALSHHHPRFVCVSDWDRDSIHLQRMQWHRDAQLARAEARTQRILMREEMRTQAREMKAQLRAERDQLREEMRSRRNEMRERSQGWIDAQ